MTRILFLFFALLPFSGFTQIYINSTKGDVKKELLLYIENNGKTKATISETDSSLLLKIPGTKTEEVNFVYTFDKTNLCLSQKVIAQCDTCIDKYLQDALRLVKYKWRKINENQYISSFEEKLIVELPADGKEYSFTILRSDWSKILYDMLNDIKQ